MSFNRFNLLIDSSQRQNINEINTNFSVNLSNGYSVKMARLKSVCIPLTYYNITSLNNTLKYLSFSVVSGTVVPAFATLTIPEGRYSVNDLITAVNNGFISTNVGTITLSYNSVNGFFTFTIDGGTDPVLSNKVYFYPTPSGLLNYLGFSSTQISSIAIHPYEYGNVRPSITSSFVPPFINADYLKLSLNYLDSSIITINNIQTNTTFFLQLDTDFQSDYFGKKINIINPNEDTGSKNIVYSNPINLQNFKITLMDRYDNILNLNGVDWNCLIELITVDKSVNNSIGVNSSDENNKSINNNLPLFWKV